MSPSFPAAQARQYLLYGKIHAFNHAVTALGIPRDQLLRITIDPDLDLSVDTPRGTLHTLNARAMAAEIVSLDTGQTTDVRIVRSPGEYQGLQASRTAPDPGTVSLTLAEYLALTADLTAQQRHLRRALHVAALGVPLACLLGAALLGWALRGHPILGALLTLALTAPALWTLLSYRARPERLLNMVGALRLAGPAWTPDGPAARQVHALLTPGLSADLTP